MRLKEKTRVLEDRPLIAYNNIRALILESKYFALYSYLLSRHGITVASSSKYLHPCESASLRFRNIGATLNVSNIGVSLGINIERYNFRGHYYKNMFLKGEK